MSARYLLEASAHLLRRRRRYRRLQMQYQWIPKKSRASFQLPGLDSPAFFIPPAHSNGSKEMTKQPGLDPHRCHTNFPFPSLLTSPINAPNQGSAHARFQPFRVTQSGDSCSSCISFQRRRLPSTNQMVHDSESRTASDRDCHRVVPQFARR